MGGLTVAIRVVEGHARRAGGQQHLLQEGRGDVFGVEQAGALARGSERHICGARRRPGSKVWGGRQDFPPSPPLACSRARESLEQTEGTQGPAQQRHHDRRAARRSREDRRGRAAAPNFPGGRAPGRSEELEPYSSE